MTRGITGKGMIALGIVFTIALLSGVGGLLMMCHASALIPANFRADGHCHATDRPEDVFVAFAILGILVGSVAVIAVILWFATRRRVGA